MAGQFVYTFVTMAPSAIWLYDSKFLSVVWIITFFRSVVLVERVLTV